MFNPLMGFMNFFLWMLIIYSCIVANVQVKPHTEVDCHAAGNNVTINAHQV